MRATLTATLLVACISGCGGEGSAPPVPVFPVSGKVTYKGQPVVGADITFSSEGANRSAFGRTDDQGEYHLTTFKVNDGAVEGKQTVTISKTIAPPPTEPEAPTESEAYVPPGFGPPPKEVKVEQGLPVKYGSAATSGLIAIVTTNKADNVFDFDLKD